jgi:transaldolase
MTESSTARLAAEGVSIWLDDLSRDLINSGGLQRLIDTRNVVGVTSNPTIFATALSKGDAYDEQVRELAAAGKDVQEAVFEITTTDVRNAADVFAPVYEASGHVDGRVSIEVEPGLAHDAQGTVAQVKQLWAKVDKPNAMIKIPATKAGIEAIAAATAAGINVNVTLIFSLERYREVINAYLTGLEQAKAAGIDLKGIRSVASFFVSRVDAEIDKRLAAIGTPEALALKGKAAVANARLAYQVFEQAFASERAKVLLEAGAHKQRPLWASTGVKDPSYPDTLYVTTLVAPDEVNTMPEKTLEATFDHGEITGNSIEGTYEESNAVLDAIAALGISYDDVTQLLEDEGVEKFIVSWGQLLDTVSAALAKASAAETAR